MPQIPRITTARLLLREFQSTDFEPYAAMMADPEVTRFLSDGKALGRFDAWRQMAMFAGHWLLHGFGIWAVEERATGVFIGRIGCFQPEGWPGFEVGYTLARHAWGRGYAREGAAASLDYARRTLRRDRIVSVIRPDNTPSIRVAESLGATHERDIEFFGGTSRLYVYPSVGAE